ncbi:zinc finger MYM-type protein 1-like [Mya arenaria]|uniref:zinc finger MYM-type protein 1-like n=1 Tax=Mya arenaria TaxID=6604 RepID=UPI0022E900D9|nr:zinc finger MYM-type protein 1-like [Mya arenaria]
MVADFCNFMQLLKLHGQADPTILSWIEKKSDKYTSPPIQNEIIQIMALGILTRKVAHSVLEDAFFTIMVDETTDVSNREQVVLVLRHVDSELNVQENFIGLYVVPSIDAQTITNVIKDTLLRMILQLSKCRGQCYDGASNMSGTKRGVATNITAEEPRAIYTHCYGYALNLAVGDTIRGSKVMRDSLDALHEISKLVKFSPKRDGQFEELRMEMSPDTPRFRVLCPTRWTVRAECLKSVLDNYSVLQKLWDTTYETTRDTETRARIVGAKSQMVAFDFLYGVTLGYELLKHSDNLSKALQYKDMSASEGHDLAHVTVSTLSKLRTDDAYHQFWGSIDTKLDNVDVNEPTLPQGCKLPKRYETGDADYEYPNSPKDLYRQQYFEALDMAINCIQDRFDQPGFRLYTRLQDSLLKSVVEDPTAADDIQHVMEVYKGDINEVAFGTQVDSLRTLL